MRSAALLVLVTLVLTFSIVALIVKFADVTMVEQPQMEWRCTIDPLRVQGGTTFIVVWYNTEASLPGRLIQLERATCGYGLLRTNFRGPGVQLSDLQPDSTSFKTAGDVIILPPASLEAP